MTESYIARNGDKWEIYKDNSEEWRWRCKAPFYDDVAAFIG